MNATRSAALPLALALLALPTLPLPAVAQDWVIPSGTTVRYDTLNGRVVVDNLIIEPDAALRVVGPRPFFLVAKNTVRVDGLLDLSGFDNIGVTTLNLTYIPELGAPGAAGGGSGGVGSRMTSQSTPAGGDGFGGFEVPGSGGGGGETGYALGGFNQRRAAGGGGGALALDQPIPGIPEDDELNRGLLARSGQNGSSVASGALSGSPPPQGGAPGPRAFVDGDPTNDFWGRKLGGGQIIQGELTRPVPGNGGGAGGDAVDSNTFPPVPFDPNGDEKGAGGGGAGGLGVVVARRVEVGTAGRILAEGGAGGGGENTSFFNHVGGGSGGGSGGMLILEATVFDLSAAGIDALSARGGSGGPGANHVPGATGAGGDGGPGVIQLHTPSGTTNEILAPSGLDLEDLSAPDLHVLLPNFL